jgi:TonB family protein
MTKIGPKRFDRFPVWAYFGHVTVNPMRPAPNLLMMFPVLMAWACGARQPAAGTGSPQLSPCCPVTVYEMPEVEEPASFPGGESAMYAWLGNNLQYPVKAAGSGVQGTTWVRFNVECDGRLVDVQVQRGVDAALDSAAVELVRSMPAWSPGRHKGEPVCVQYLLPVNFVLK